MFFSAAGDDKTFAQVGKVVRAAADDDDDERLGQFLTVSSTSTWTWTCGCTKCLRVLRTGAVTEWERKKDKELVRMSESVDVNLHMCLGVYVFEREREAIPT